MPAITGEIYKKRLKQSEVELWHNGEKIKNMLEHPVFKGIINSQALLYDAQHQFDCMTYRSPETGNLLVRPICSQPLKKTLPNAEK